MGRPATEEDPALPVGDEHKGTLRVRNVAVPWDGPSGHVTGGAISRWDPGGWVAGVRADDGPADPAGAEPADVVGAAAGDVGGDYAADVADVAWAGADELEPCEVHP
ncbi:MAG: hypothetical protein ACRDPD_23215, partial [Streptosporangiaceae bacterium]